MDISWLGHSCFRIKGKEATVITDPFDTTIGYSLGKPTANIVTISHDHPGHNNASAVGGNPKIVRGPGEYEIANVLISGIRTYHDTQKGKKRGKNTVYLMEIDSMVVCHMGDLGHVPTMDQIEEMSNVDILLVPVGGESTINATAAAETVNLLEPKIVIPMHFRTEAVKVKLEPLARFLKEMGLKDVPTQPKLTLSKTGIPQESQVMVLDYGR